MCINLTVVAIVIITLATWIIVSIVLAIIFVVLIALRSAIVTKWLLMRLSALIVKLVCA
jgi:hypothetical protein